jgi:hypothetical protein
MDTIKTFKEYRAFLVCEIVTAFSEWRKHTERHPNKEIAAHIMAIEEHYLAFMTTDLWAASITLSFPRPAPKIAKKIQHVYILINTCIQYTHKTDTDAHKRAKIWIVKFITYFTDKTKIKHTNDENRDGLIDAQDIIKTNMQLYRDSDHTRNDDRQIVYILRHMGFPVVNTELQRLSMYEDEEGFGVGKIRAPPFMHDEVSDMPAASLIRTMARNDSIDRWMEKRAEKCFYD